MLKLGMGALTATIQAFGQDPTALLEAQALRATSQAPATADLTSRSAPAATNQVDEQAVHRLDQERLEKEIWAAKAREGVVSRFAADLFETRQFGFGLTDGGISEDYVLGVGDRLQMNVFGSANQEVPLQVDGRGGVVIPRVGTVPVAGMTLAKARAALQAKVGQMFSRSTVDLAVTKLREVRIFVLGEVYKPGSFLVPNLTSIVNALGLSGGPTAIGSFREIRVLRGGKLVHAVDLYPLRAEGLGNLNFGFQNGDTLFVPLVQNQVQLEGGFTRVVASVLGPTPGQNDGDESQGSSPEQRRLAREIKTLDAQLAPAPRVVGLGPARDAGVPEPGSAPALTATSRADLEALRIELKSQLANLRIKGRGDQRIEPDTGEGMAHVASEAEGQAAWLSRWMLTGKAPVMLFEMLPGETVKDALRFAGGFALQAFSGSVTLRRVAATGALEVTDVGAEAMARTALQRGDALTALPLRDQSGGAVTVSGWTRVQGAFAWTQGQRIGDFLKRLAQVLPDTYMERGELVRTLPDHSKQYLAFNLSKALAGDAQHNLPLQARDAIELYRVGDMRLQRTLTVVGPVTRQGTYEFLDGMRASDLVFRAGLPLLSANRYIAELTHVRDGKPAEIRKLDLTRLISTEFASPVDLKDDLLNPLLEPFDLLSIYAKTDYRQHRTVLLSGQVVRPGSYEVDAAGTTLKDIVARAGGLTPDAMPSAGIFLRSLVKASGEKARASVLAGVQGGDPTANGINEILSRLNEKKLVNAPNSPQNGTLQQTPILHNLQAGGLNRLVVNFPAMLAGDPAAQVDLLDGDEIVIPRKTDVAYVVGEAASPFAAFKAAPGMTVKDLLNMAGGPTRNADMWNMRLLKADGRILDSWLNRKSVEPGDALLIPQRIHRDVTWQENLSALTPLAIMVNAVKK
jgi:protein involved in polysaccharide export with SLBB domain